MVTREEYNKALDVIEEYHKQLFNIDKISYFRDSQKTLLRDFAQNQDCSSRLRGTLLNNGDLFLEDITSRDFKMFRGAGKKTWIEFVKLRGY